MSIAEIETQFPELAPVSANHLGEGCDSVALLVNGYWVFRFPKSVEVERQLAIERPLLAILAGRLPLPVPRYTYVGRAGQHFPRAFVGYPKLAGDSCLGVAADELPASEVAKLGAFLAALHAVNADDARQCGVPTEDLATSMSEIRTEALESMEDVARLAPEAPLDVWRAFLSAPPSVPPDHPRALAHNDFAAEHLLIHPETKRLTGVIDWSDAAIIHPCVDFGGLFHWGGERFARTVLAAYRRAGGRLDEEGCRLARYLGAARGAGDVVFGVEMQRQEYIAGGLRALRLCCAP